MIFARDPYDYSICKKIGKGVSGSVDLCQSKTGKLFVVKTYHCKESYELKREYHKRVLYEYELLMKLNHLNIISVYQKKISFTGSVVKMYMEAGSMDFKKYLNRTSQTDILPLWKQLCNAIRYLHVDLNLCHRDLKLENLVILESEPDGKPILKVIDFATCVSTAELAMGIVGTEHYASPESFLQIRYDGEKADIWSIGVILYYILRKRFVWKVASHIDKEYVRYEETVKQYETEAAADVEEATGYEIEGGEEENSGDEKNIDSDLATEYFRERGIELPIARILKRILNPNPAKRLNIADFDQFVWFQKLPESF